MAGKNNNAEALAWSRILVSGYDNLCYGRVGVSVLVTTVLKFKDVCAAQRTKISSA